MITKREATELLRNAFGDPDARFREGQWEAIDALVNRRLRSLVVQRTGWGKSMVYFLATRIFRDQGAGPTLIISPLISLMRNQIEAANGLDLVAETINAENPDEWPDIIERAKSGEIDLLLVSPERLSNERFMENCLVPISANIAFFVVDEAHCISDWGHDFRPDYQRINRILRQLPANIAVLATTATANNRVVEDVLVQLGEGTQLLRGPLARASLRLQTLEMPSPGARLAWLADHIPDLPGSGIVYALTKRDANRIAEWLRLQGITAHAYHADAGAEEGEGPSRADLERMLLRNEIKVLVATTALGMGFDKPDLGFVIHYQAPQSVVHYYQQVGRAGRGIDEAYGVLLSGTEDDEINQFFIGQAFPPERDIETIVDALEEADEGLTVDGLLNEVNLRKGQIEKVLKLLAVADNPPIAKVGSRWMRTPNPLRLDHDRFRRLTDRRQQEWAEMQGYITSETCLMAYLQRALDDPNPQPCGRCAVCQGRDIVSSMPRPATVRAANEFSRRSDIPLEPRKRWASGAFPDYGWSGLIRENRRVETGRALAYWRDAGWGEEIEAGKEAGRFSDDLVEACADMIQNRWRPDPAPTWVTCIPSLRSPELMPDFARRLADRLGVPFREAVVKVKETERQRNMMNSQRQAHNLNGAFAVDQDAILPGPVLLVDDVADSRWSLAVAGALLRDAGVPKVYPMVLAYAGVGGD